MIGRQKDYENPDIAPRKRSRSPGNVQRHHTDPYRAYVQRGGYERREIVCGVGELHRKNVRHEFHGNEKTYRSASESERKRGRRNFCHSSPSRSARENSSGGIAKYHRPRPQMIHGRKESFGSGSRRYHQVKYLRFSQKNRIENPEGRHPIGNRIHNLQGSGYRKGFRPCDGLRIVVQESQIPGIVPESH